MKQYRKDNKNKISNHNKSYRKKNKHLINKWAADRRAAKLQATPQWADHDAIAKIYEESANLPHDTHVDHVIPLQSDIVCGLHVPENLEIIPASDNMSKSNVIDQHKESEYQLQLIKQLAK